MKGTPSVTDYAALNSFLEKHNACFLWSALSDSAHAVLQGWRINGRVCIVFLYTHTPGWDLFTSTDSVGITETIADVEKRLGVAS